MTWTDRFIFAAATAGAGGIVAASIYPTIAGHVGFVLGGSVSAGAIYHGAAMLGAAVMGALLWSGFGRPDSAGGLVALAASLVMTLSAACLAAYMAALMALSGDAEITGAWGLGIVTLMTGVVAIRPLFIWLIGMAALHELAKLLRRRRARRQGQFT